MTLSRRKMLALIGGGTIAAAAAGATAFATTRTPTKALAPWGLAGQYGEIRKDALSWALLAPNPHNMQPWLVELVGTDQVILHLNRDKLLPHTDPYNRQITIGLGCFLELMTLAAAQSGYGVDLDLFPQGEDGPIAIATFQPGAAQPDPLFAHAANRRSCKEPFAATPVPTNLAAQLDATVITDPTEVAALRDLGWRAFEIEMSTPRTLKESIDVIRVGKAAVNATPDGIDLSGAMFDILKPLGMVTHGAMMDPDSTATQQNMAAYAEIFANTPAFVAHTSASNTRADQIAAGRRWLRLNLQTTAMGLSLQPVSQALQEYPEMAALYAEAHQKLAAPGETVQMLGRLGYGPTVAHSPRWPLDAKLVNA